MFEPIDALPRPVPDAGAFAHPDAQRRFRVLTNVEELERALDYPWEKWAIFLHPVAFVLCLVNILGRTNLSGLQKLVWILVTLIWGIGPILYVLVGGGEMW